MAKAKNPEREKMYKENSSKKFAKQRAALIKPNAIDFIACTILFIILLIMDKPSVIFDETSSLFSVLLIINTLVPLVALIIVLFATKTTHLLMSVSLNQLCIVPLIIAYFMRYEELKNCSSYHMLIFVFLFLISYLVMTTIMFNLKSRLLSTMEEK